MPIANDYDNLLKYIIFDDFLFRLLLLRFGIKPPFGGELLSFSKKKNKKKRFAKKSLKKCEMKYVAINIGNVWTGDERVCDGMF